MKNEKRTRTKRRGEEKGKKMSRRHLQLLLREREKKKT